MNINYYYLFVSVTYLFPCLCVICIYFFQYMLLLPSFCFFLYFFSLFFIATSYNLFFFLVYLRRIFYSFFIFTLPGFRLSVFFLYLLLAFFSFFSCQCNHYDACFSAARGTYKQQTHILWWWKKLHNRAVEQYQINYCRIHSTPPEGKKKENNSVPFVDKTGYTQSNNNLSRRNIRCCDTWAASLSCVINLAS